MCMRACVYLFIVSSMFSVESSVDLVLMLKIYSRSICKNYKCGLYSHLSLYAIASASCDDVTGCVKAAILSNSPNLEPRATQGSKNPEDMEHRTRCSNSSPLSACTDPMRVDGGGNYFTSPYHCLDIHCTEQ